MTLHPLTIDTMNTYHLEMEKEMLKIRVLDIHTEQVLFECALTESERAYEFAAQMEEMGLDVKVDSPTLSQTLTQSLGLSNEEQATYQASMEEEMEDHDASCCFDGPEKTKH
jgi:hypothetical protein